MVINLWELRSDLSWKDAASSAKESQEAVWTICLGEKAFSFPLVYDLNGFKSRINRHLLTVGSF